MPERNLPAGTRMLRPMLIQLSSCSAHLMRTLKEILRLSVSTSGKHSSKYQQNKQDRLYPRTKKSSVVLCNGLISLLDQSVHFAQPVSSVLSSQKTKQRPLSTTGKRPLFLYFLCSILSGRTNSITQFNEISSMVQYINCSRCNRNDFFVASNCSLIF